MLKHKYMDSVTVVVSFIVYKIYFCLVLIYRSVVFKGNNKYAKKVLTRPSNALMLQLSLSVRDR